VARPRKIGVLCGGDSLEREVSLRSGAHVAGGLRNAGHLVCVLEIPSLAEVVGAVSPVDAVFICLHGGSGEDGTVQFLFEVMGVPYVGSGPQASALAMDKPRSKELLSMRGLPVPRAVLRRDDDLPGFCAGALSALGLPLVLKPCDQGSSLGVRIIREEAELVPAAEAVVSQFRSVFAEEYIPGRELTVGILRIGGEDKALPAVEILPTKSFFDYEAKYTEGASELVAPASLPGGTAARVAETALVAHRTLSCYGFSRVDLRLAEDGTPYVLEVNTLPGMTEHSLLPRAAEAAGIPLPCLVDRMLASAFDGGERR
jgi:D-alanine-D-alanine ligase